jgi:hypothetical protein
MLWFGWLIHLFGHVAGKRETALALLRDGKIVACTPGGVEEVSLFWWTMLTCILWPRYFVCCKVEQNSGKNRTPRCVYAGNNEMMKSQVMRSRHLLLIHHA